MKMYQVKQAGGEFSVVETRTQQVMSRQESYRAARALASKLTGGRAFNGFTPAFFIANTAPASIWALDS